MVRLYNSSLPGCCLRLLVVAWSVGRAPAAAPVLHTADIFPRTQQHVHGATVVALPNGSLLAAWFQGSGERWADDVAIMGARLSPGASVWTRPFLMADVPGFPDINPVLFCDTSQRLWLVWYTVIANQWETSLLKYRLSDDYQQEEGPPHWYWQSVLHVKPGDPAERGIQPSDRFVAAVSRQIDGYARYLAEECDASPATIALWHAWGQDLRAKARGAGMLRRGRLYDGKGAFAEQQLGYPYFRRMGWQTKNKAIVTGSGRIILPLYSDGFSFSLMALTDDGGAHWHFSTPLVGPGNIQPTLGVKSDGMLVAYMRDNGPPPKRHHMSYSDDNGVTWSIVRDASLPNPGSGSDMVTLRNGHWVIAYNNTEQGRHRLAVSLSINEGASWDWTRYLARDTRERREVWGFAYPSIIEGKDARLHVVYSLHERNRQGRPSKTIRYATFPEEWITQ